MRKKTFYERFMALVEHCTSNRLGSRFGDYYAIHVMLTDTANGSRHWICSIEHNYTTIITLHHDGRIDGDPWLADILLQRLEAFIFEEKTNEEKKCKKDID